MKLARAALGANPLQTSLIPETHEPAALLGDTAATVDRYRLAGQFDRVESIMADGFWHTLPELSKVLVQRFGQRYSETSISARLRDMRKHEWQIECQRTRRGSGLFQYRALRGIAA